LEDLKKQAAEFLRQEARVATPEQKAQVLALARDLTHVSGQTLVVDGGQSLHR